MLTHIHIRNFTIINDLEISLDSGMSVLTGETGAGKSILIDALGLVLGNRTESGVIRQDADKAEISASFDTSQLPHVNRWLADHDLDMINECHLRRTLVRNGRSRAYINGSTVPLANLNSLGELLVEIHGQHDHQMLLRSVTQRQLLDAHAFNGDRLTQLANLYQDRQTLKHKLASLQQKKDDHSARKELLRYQIEELQALGLTRDESVELEIELHKLGNAEQIKTSLENAYGSLYGEETTVYSELSRVIRLLESIHDLAPGIEEQLELLRSTEVQAQEAASALQHHTEGIESNPERLQWVENRLTTLSDLARKHGVEPVDLPGHLQHLETELADLEGPEFDLDELSSTLHQTENEYRILAQQIRTTRRSTATKLNSDISAAMQVLGMRGGKFKIDVNPRSNTDYSATGMDRVAFKVSANPGQPLQLLSKVASGGELSRISLAIQMIAAQHFKLPTLVFDEIDTGIGGGVAETVGNYLRNLGEQCQVLCVTHLAQVAAQAHTHFRINKTKINGTVLTQIALLEPQKRVEEVARMLGGLKLTKRTREHAQEMIDFAQSS